MRILISGTRSRYYPPEGVRLAFDLVRVTVGDAPVVVVHGQCPSGVDDMADQLAPAYGWDTEPHPADWYRCSPLCKGEDSSHRRTRFGKSYCPLAGFWRNQQMVDLHKDPKFGPYRLGLFLPNRTWAASQGTYDCYKRANAAGITCISLGPDGHFFTDPTRKAVKRK